MTQIRIEGLTKLYGDTRALNGIDLEIRGGELFFLLGPSGCGKSTLLRTIAGLQTATAGRILFDGRDVTAVETQKRNAVMCFQGYALWPHMTVRENIRFGLSVREAARGVQLTQVDKALDIVQMRDLADRKPQELSGGQQQRVALARALAVEPACLLLDEPLSNLDTHLRQELRREIQRICRQAEITTIYVTHDQKEALSTANRIAVMKDGGVVQVGTPQELYSAPVNAFVAEFMGETNLIEGVVTAAGDGLVRVATGVGEIVAAVAPEDGRAVAGAPMMGRAVGARSLGATQVGTRVMLSVRPELIRIAPAGGDDAGRELVARPGGDAASVGAVSRVGVTAGAAVARHASLNRLTGAIVESTFFGQSSEHLVAVGSGRLTVVSAPPQSGITGAVALELAPADVVVLER
ncbi:MAG: ABC transporter ATP-binding protein [Proteobacteria bacterium]|nr:ABC transporter ATP-binding protein [Pseudomonadota bacterium]